MNYMHTQPNTLMCVHMHLYYIHTYAITGKHIPFTIGEYIAIPAKTATVFDKINPPKLLISMADRTGIHPLYRTECVLVL